MITPRALIDDLDLIMVPAISTSSMCSNFFCKDNHFRFVLVNLHASPSKFVYMLLAYFFDLFSRFIHGVCCDD
jgi:hypothetical protein